MNPMTTEMYEGNGGGNSLLIIIGWFLYLLAAYSIAKALKLSNKNSRRLWAICNVAPILFLVIVGHFSFLPFLGLSIMALFSYAMGGAMFDNVESTYANKERHLDDTNDNEETQEIITKEEPRVDDTNDHQETQESTEAEKKKADFHKWFETLSPRTQKELLEAEKERRAEERQQQKQDSK